MENWYILKNLQNYNILKNNENFSTLQKIILSNRGIIDQYSINTILNSDIKNTHSPFLLKNMRKAVDILMESIRKNENILVVGDYDQDGVSSTVILLKGIGKFYKNIDYVIPNRIEDGYGLNDSIVDYAFENNFNLLLTCDNGIAALESVDYAKNKGLKVIVTDHHQVVNIDNSEILPNADACVNPHISDDEYPFKSICGAMVAYKFIQAIYESYGNSLGIDTNYLYELIPYVALGTVCDMMPIINENRIFVIEGLKLINSGNIKGINILLEKYEWISEVDIYTLGFIIGPSINASGRIYTAKLGVELFIEEDIDVLREYAEELICLNNERKSMTQNSVKTAITRIEDEKLYNNDIIILYENSIHESICGLVAGKIKDHYNKPTIILTDSSEKNIIKGSGRSIKNYNIFEELNKFRDYYINFGGHKMACGLSLNKNKLNELYKNLLEESKLTQNDFIKELEIDYILKFNMINQKTLQDIKNLAPYGYGFSTPIFATKNAKVLNARLLGKNKNVLKLLLDDGTSKMTAIGFSLDKLVNILNVEDINNVEELEKLENKTLSLVYKIVENNYKGYINIQLEIVSMR